MYSLKINIILKKTLWWTYSTYYSQALVMTMFVWNAKIGCLVSMAENVLSLVGIWFGHVLYFVNRFNVVLSKSEYILVAKLNNEKRY